MELLHEATQKPVLNVLLIEDTEQDARLAQHALEGGDGKLTVHLVTTVEEALTFLAGGAPREVPHPHLIITDLKLPDKSGFEFLMEARDLKLDDVPIIVLSTSDDPSDIRRAYRLGAAMYIVKPRDLGKFEVVVHLVERVYVEAVALLDHHGGVRVPTT